MKSKAAAILFLIALSGCAENIDASDPPAIGLAAEPGAELAAEMASEMPETLANSASVAESPGEATSEPAMRSPVLLD